MMMKYLALILLVFAPLLQAGARQIDDYQWEDVERIVAVGDLHGDYDNYIATLRAAGLIDRKGKWSGGNTHLVQTGDIPDRGPGTLKIIEHITRLAKQAKRKGGFVHTLIGNHEAMNVYGDLRYTHPGEFKAFKTRKSAALRDRYFELVLQNIEKNDPEQFAALPDNFRELWDEKHPLGWIEHRQAWDPAWNPDAKYAKWVLNHPVAIRINNMIFVHGGLSGFYCQNAFGWFADRVHAGLAHYDPQAPGILEDESGPLWYRGLSGVPPEAAQETVDAILQQHGGQHIVVGHTPTSGVIWPGYDSKVIMIDTGISSAYGGYIGYLEITPEGLFAGYPGGKLKLPASDDERAAYLEKVIAMDPTNPFLPRRLQRLQQPAASAAAGEADQAAQEHAESGEGTEKEKQPAEARPVPICGISQ